MKCFDSLKNTKISHREMTLLITKWRTFDMSSKFCNGIFNFFLFIFSDRHFDDDIRSIISDDVASPSVYPATLRTLFQESENLSVHWIPPLVLTLYLRIRTIFISRFGYIHALPRLSISSRCIYVPYLTHFIYSLRLLMSISTRFFILILMYLCLTVLLVVQHFFLVFFRLLSHCLEPQDTRYLGQETPLSLFVSTPLTETLYSKKERVRSRDLIPARAYRIPKLYFEGELEMFLKGKDKVLIDSGRSRDSSNLHSLQTRGSACTSSVRNFPSGSIGAPYISTRPLERITNSFTTPSRIHTYQEDHC
jgi:hypothetical protein